AASLTEHGGGRFSGLVAGALQDGADNLVESFDLYTRAIEAGRHVDRIVKLTQSGCQVVGQVPCKRCQQNASIRMLERQPSCPVEGDDGLAGAGPTRQAEGSVPVSIDVATLFGVQE